MANLVMPNGKPLPYQAELNAAKQQATRPTGGVETARPDMVATRGPESVWGGRPAEVTPFAQNQQPQGPPTGYNSDPNQAFSYFNQQYKTKFNTQQDMPEAHKNILAQYAGYTGGPVSEEQFRKAQYLFDNYQQGQPLPTYTPQGEAPQGGQKLPTTGSGQTVSGVPPAYQMTQQQPQQQISQAYQPQQYANPFQQQQQGLMQSILGSPDTMSQTWQDQMFEQQKEMQADFAKQQQVSNAQSTASRGLSARGGNQQMLDAQTQQDMQRNLLAGRRDIATQAATQNRQDQLNALQASMGLQGQEFDQYLASQGLGRQASEDTFSRERFTGEHGLDRWRAEQDARQRQADSEMGRAEFDFNQRDTDRQRLLQEWLARQQAMQQAAQMQQQNQQFGQTFGLDILEYLEGGRQFDTSLGEKIRQFNEQMGFNWSGQQFNQQNSLLESILG